MSTKLVGRQDPLVHQGPAAQGDRAARSWICKLPDPPVHLPGPVRGLIFDACDVLYDDTAWRRWLLRLLMRLGLRTSYRSFFRVLDRDYLDDVYRGRREFCEALTAFLLAAGLSPGQVEEVQVAWQTHHRERDGRLRPLTGIPETLRQLHGSGLTLGVLCNCEHASSVLAARLERMLGGTSPFSAVISSRDLGRTMPDAACYHAALKAMGLPAGEVAFVGHDPMELEGAADSGMSTVAFNYDSDARADVFLQRFENLLELAAPSAACAAA